MFTQNHKLNEQKSSIQIMGGRERDGKEQEEGEEKSGESSERASLIVVESSTIEDVPFLRRRVAALSKISLQLGKRVLEQQQKLVIGGQQANCDIPGQSPLVLQNKALRSQVESLKQRQLQLERLLLANQSQPILIKPQLHEVSTSVLPSQKQLSIQKQVLLSKNQELSATIRQLSDQLSKKEQQIKKLSHLPAEITKMNAAIKKISDMLGQIQQELSTAKHENLQLKKDIEDLRQSERQSEELTLVKLSINSESQSFKTELEHRQMELSELKEKHKKLRHNYDQLKIEINYLKERYESSLLDQREQEHAVVDRFRKALLAFREKIKDEQEEALRQFMESKKEAFMRRLEKQFVTLMQEKLT